MQGVVCIGDFGHTQVLDEVLGREGFTAYTGSSNMRWNAPELLGSDDIKPTKASDVFAFGKSILELVIKQAPPYSHRKRDLTVIMDVGDSRLPLRPTEPEDISRWMHVELWKVLNKRWHFRGHARETSTRQLTGNHDAPILLSVIQSESEPGLIITVEGHPEELAFKKQRKSYKRYENSVMNPLAITRCMESRISKDMVEVQARYMTCNRRYSISVQDASQILSFRIIFGHDRLSCLVKSAYEFLDVPGYQCRVTSKLPDYVEGPFCDQAHNPRSLR